MPRIPRYQSGQELTTPRYFRPPVLSAGVVGAAISNVGDSITYVAERFREAENAAEFSDKKALMLGQLNDLQLDFEKDPDRRYPEEDPKSYEEKAKEIYSGIDSDIQDLRVKRALKDSFNRTLPYKKAQVTRSVRHKFADYEISIMPQRIDMYLKMYAEAGSAPEQAHYMAQAQAEVNGRVAAGVISQEAGQKYITDINYDAEKMRVWHVVQALDYETGIAWLEDDEKTPDLKPEDRKSMTSELKTRWGLQIAKEKEQSRIRIKTSQDQLLEQFHSGDLTMDDIRASQLDPFGQGSKDTFFKMLKSQASASMNKDPDPFEVTDVGGYYNPLLEKAYAGQVDPNKVVPVAGKLSKTDAKYIRGIAAQSRDEAESKILELEKLAIDDGRKMIVKGTLLTGFKATEVKDAYLYEHALRIALEEGKSEGKSMRDMLTPGTKEYIVDQVIAPYLKSPMDRMRQEVESMQGRTEKPEKSSIKKRKEGETITEYLKRAGRK